MAAAESGYNWPEKWAEAHLRCKGGLGDDMKTHHACGQRDAFVMVLIDQGYCWRRDLDVRWAKCRATDPKPTLADFISKE